jgi:hypothetical protein
VFPILPPLNDPIYLMMSKHKNVYLLKRTQNEMSHVNAVSLNGPHELLNIISIAWFRSIKLVDVLFTSIIGILIAAASSYILRRILFSNNMPSDKKI